MTTELIKKKLTETIKPEVIELIDDSAAHAGHAGAKNGAGHYYLTIVADAFNDMSMVQRHQLIYQTLGDMMKNEIHALGINALTPSENV